MNRGRRMLCKRRWDEAIQRTVEVCEKEDPPLSHEIAEDREVWHNLDCCARMYHSCRICVDQGENMGE